MTASKLRRVTVVGCGTIGTSIARALTRAHVQVALEDLDPRAVAEAELLGAGRRLTAATRAADLVVVATPPSTVVDVLYVAQSRGLGRAYTDVAGVKELICAEAELRGSDLMGYVPGHPCTDSEPSRSAGSDADLFVGRPWVVCPYPASDESALAAVDTLISLCGAHRVVMAPEEHDRALATVSHAPRLVLAALAAELSDRGGSILGLAGRGLLESTRPAGGDAASWDALIAQNPVEVADLIDRVAGGLARAAEELRDPRTDEAPMVGELLARGTTGRAALLAATSPAEDAEDGPGADARADRPTKPGTPPATRTVVHLTDAADRLPLLRSPRLDGSALHASPAPAPEPEPGAPRVRTDRPAGPAPRIEGFGK